MSAVRKFSISIRGHRTSISLEPEFWTTFRQLCAHENRTPADVLIEIDSTRTSNLSSAIRLWVLERLRDAAGLSDAKDD